MSEGAPTQTAAPLRIEVVHAQPDRPVRVRLELPPGATVADALQTVAGREPFAGLDLAGAAIGIYGERVERGRPLADHDRVEIYRPLLLDPVEARRRRGRATRTS